MFQNGQRVCFKNGGDPARIQKVQLAYGKDRSRAPQVIPTTDTNATQVQIVTGEDAARYPFIDPIGLIGAPAAWFRADTGVTVTGLGASTWADQSGNGRDLLQGTDANRPPYLSYSGTKYLYLPGVAGNYASTPDSAAADLTTELDIRVKVALADYTPSAIQNLCGKWQSSGQYSYTFDILNTTGLMSLFISQDGTVTGNVSSSAAPTVSDGSNIWLRVTWRGDTGAVKFYQSSDGDTWSQVGVDRSIATITTLKVGTSAVSVGANGGGTGNPANGKLYRAIIKNGIDGTTVVDFNPDLDGSDQAATITSSATGEVWTINKSGGLPAQIVGRPSLLFDGSADYLKCNAFTLNQPETVYLLIKAISFSAGDRLCDGQLNNSGAFFQDTNTPDVSCFAGTSTVATNSNLTLGAYKAACVVFNGASSLIQINNGTPTTGNPGASNMGGFTIGSAGPGTNFWSNIQVLEVILFSTAHDATQRARIISYLAGRHGVSL